MKVSLLRLELEYCDEALVFELPSEIKLPMRLEHYNPKEIKEIFFDE